MDKNQQNILKMAGVFLGGVLLTVVVMSASTKGSLVQGKLPSVSTLMRSAAPTIDTAPITIAGACTVTTCDLMARLNNIGEAIDAVHIDVLDSSNRTYSGIISYLSTALGNKLDTLKLDVGNAAYAVTRDVDNYLSTALGNRLEAILQRQTDLMNYLTTAMVDKLDALLAK